MTSLQKGGLVSFRMWGWIGWCLLLGSVALGTPPRPEPMPPPTNGPSLEARIRELEALKRKLEAQQRERDELRRWLEARDRELKGPRRELERQSASSSPSPPLGTASSLLGPSSYDACLVAVPADLDPKFV